MALVWPVSRCGGIHSVHAAIDAEVRRRDWDVEHFADEEASGKVIGPNLREALQFLASGQGDGLIVAKLDRLSRSIINAANILEADADAGLAIVVPDINLDLSTAAGRMMAG